jgi:twitching motility protein PilT
VIKQREIGTDTWSYPVALREAMRQDPDVIVIGEIHNEETMKAALDASETGHLVLATFSAANCTQSILRTYHFFPQDRQQEIRLQLANCLRGIISLRLLTRVDAEGVIPATEVLTCTEGVANMIRNGSIEQIPSAIQTGVRYGMHPLASSLRKLWKAGYIDMETVREHS